MAYTHAGNAPRFVRSPRPSALTAKNLRSFFCYAGFALSFGFAGAVVLGLIP